MKTLLALLLAAAALLLGPGCTRSLASTAGAKPEATTAATYKAGHGLQLSPAARDFIGLATAGAGTRDVGPARGATAVPVTALLRTIKGDFVYVANGDWFLRTPVQTGTTDGVWVEVKDGLYEGDVIVTAGARALWLAELQAVNGGVGCADGH